jgi:hypothetical protein
MNNGCGPGRFGEECGVLLVPCDDGVKQRAREERFGEASPTISFRGC